MVILRAVAVLLALTASVPAGAQDVLPPSPILIINTQRVFAETRYGQRLISELEAEAAELRAENARIVETLEEEERSLTLRRPEMEPEAFRIAAAAFDAKVQEVRRVRDAKNNVLQESRAQLRTQFDARVKDVIGTAMLERGAIMLLEERNVVLSVSAANITDEVIALIDAALGDGSQ